MVSGVSSDWVRESPCEKTAVKSQVKPISISQCFAVRSHSRVYRRLSRVKFSIKLLLSFCCLLGKWHRVCDVVCGYRHLGGKGGGYAASVFKVLQSAASSPLKLVLPSCPVGLLCPEDEDITVLRKLGILSDQRHGVTCQKT